MVGQEYIPTNVDEGEFEMSVSAPEGASLAGWRSCSTAYTPNLRPCRGCSHVVTIAGTGYSAGGEHLARLCAARRYRRPCFLHLAAVQKTLEGKPAEAFRGIYSQRDVMQASPAAHEEFPDFRVRVGNLQTINQGSAPYDIDFVIRGPDLIALNDYSERLRQYAMTTFPVSSMSIRLCG